MIVFCIADMVWLLTVARFIQGLGQAFLWLSAYTIVADVATETGRGHSFGIIDEAASRGAIIGTTAGFSAIFTLQDFFPDWPFERIWLWLFAAYTIPALLALMLIVFVTGASTAMVWPLLLYDNLGHATPFYLNTAVLLVGVLLVAVVLREAWRRSAGRSSESRREEGLPYLSSRCTILQPVQLISKRFPVIPSEGGEAAGAEESLALER